MLEEVSKGNRKVEEQAMGRHEEDGHRPGAGAPKNLLEWSRRHQIQKIRMEKHNVILSS